MAATNFFDQIQHLRRVISDAESGKMSITAALDQLADLLRDDDVRREFFGLLKSPLWIETLRQRDYFSRVPGVIAVQDGGKRAEPWPAGQYLVAMASVAPKQVADTLRNIVTPNWVVAHMVLRAALAMPAVDAATLVSTIAELISDLRLWHLLEDVGELVSRLAAANEADVAMQLLDAAFGIRQAKGLLGSRQGQDHSYLMGIGKAVAALLPQMPVEVLTRIVDWQIQAMQSDDEHRRADDDYSYVWRPAIEDHEQNKDFDLAAKLVTVLRDAFEEAVRRGYVAFTEALKILDAQSSNLLSRLRLHLIAEFGDANPALARKTMLDKELFTNYWAKHEYARLMGKRFNLLNRDEQALWLGWVDAGPEADDAADEQARVSRREYWQFSHLHWVRDHLVGDRLKFYKRMHAEHGDPELSEFNVFFGDVKWEGEEALSIESLAPQSFEEALTTLATWRPDPEAPSIRFTHYDPDRAFQQYLELKPEEHSAHAGTLEGAKTHLIRAFLNVMSAAAKDGKAIDVRAVLNLCKWVLDNPPKAVNKDEREDWTRDAVVRVIDDVCSSRKESRPSYGLEYRDAIKAMLPKILDVPHTAYVQLPKADDDIRLQDWPLVVINSPKGNAMRALYAYADWLIDHEGVDRTKEPKLPGGFESMPEIRELLDAELVAKEQSFVSRAPFGWRLGLLHWIDAEWLRDRTDRIFNLRDVEQHPAKAFGWGAWNCFLNSAQPHVIFYRLLKDQFSYAVDQAAHLEKAQDSRREPFARLAEHLILLYGRGDLGKTLNEAWEADGGVLRRLIASSHSSVSSHAMQFVGMSLREDTEDLPKEVIERFKSLWEKYWAEVGERHAARIKSNGIFGYWLASPAFEPEWLIEQLERVVQVAPKADPDHFIMDRLAEDCDVDPARCARIVRLMAQGDDEGWRVPSWKKEARTILQVAMDAGGDARKEALMTRDVLGRLGYLEFESVGASPAAPKNA